jgi:segregation and condensation protein A
MAEKYKVQLEVFEGPLDLLLYLIQKEEIDIHDIPISSITQQYLRYLEMMRLLDLDIAGEFVLMAATLMHIKSRMLLPPEEQPPLEEEEDPRLDLVRQLVEYKKFKEIAEDLSQKEYSQSKLFQRVAAQDTISSDQKKLDVSLFDLLGAFSAVLKRLQADGLREVYEEQFTVADKILFVRDLIRRQGKVGFSELFQGVVSRGEVVVTFLALLELMRLNELRSFQEVPFGPIMMERR